MRKQLVVCAALAVSGCASEERLNGAGAVTQIAPGVQMIDGSKADNQQVDLPALEALLAKRGSFSDVKRMIGGSATVYPAGPATMVHMYTMQDVATQRKVLVLVFVGGGNKVVDSLVTDRSDPPPKPAPQ